ncbi:hypothetical protein [Prosthecobacter sp.]|uniref:hypothetical protein n=1 Tax=Prosthecobacter sp. TaxID=1965333 RepID=UPI0037851576
MNTEEAAIEVCHYSLVDYISMAGWTSRPLVLSILGLLILGIILFKKRPSPSVRWGYTMAASLPLFIGFVGTTTGLMTVLSTLGLKGPPDRARFHAAMGEVILPLTIGLFGAAIAMTLAFFIWMRSMKPAGQ